MYFHNSTFFGSSNRGKVKEQTTVLSIIPFFHYSLLALLTKRWIDSLLWDPCRNHVIELEGKEQHLTRLELINQFSLKILMCAYLSFSFGSNRNYPSYSLPLPLYLLYPLFSPMSNFFTVSCKIPRPWIETKTK